MKQGTVRRTIHYYWQVTKNYKLSVAIYLIIVPVAVISGDIAVPYVTSIILDKLAGYGDDPATKAAIIRLVWLEIALIFVHFAAWRLNGLLFIRQQAKAMRDLEQLVFSKLMRHSYHFFTNRFGGALVAQATRFVNAYERLQDIIAFDISTSLIRLTAATIILTIKLPVIGIALIIWCTLYTLSVIWLSIKKLPLTKRTVKADSRVTAALADSITNALNIKIFGRRNYEKERFADVSNDRLHIRLRSWYTDEAIRAYMSLSMFFFEVFVLWMSVNAIFNHTASLAIVLLAQFYILRTFGDLWSISNLIRRIEGSFADATEMTEILDTDIDVIDPVDPITPQIKEGKIEFRDVSFQYDKKENHVFKGFNLTITPSEKVGFVGHSGSGKTTLTKLLLRFGDLQAGQILVDGHDITQIKQDELRTKFAYVPQEPILFHRSLEENILYGRLDATKSELKKAAKLAHADEFISELPKGYSTLVGERGIKLSGGEKQRVAIARAMLSEAPILVLDEATSALDSKSEKLIADALDKLMKGRTTIVIAHRLSTIRRMDRIIVMDRGKIVEQGSHEDLLAKKGKYYELWSHQSGDFLEN